MMKKNFFFLQLSLMLLSYAGVAQYNYTIKGVNTWGLWGKPGSLEEFGLTTVITFDDYEPVHGSVRGKASINIKGEVRGDLAYFQAYMTGYSISWVYLNGKWQTVKKIRECTDNDVFKLNSLTFQARHDISIKEKILHFITRTYTITPPGGGKSVIVEHFDPEGTVDSTKIMPHIVSLISSGLSSNASIQMTPQIIAHMGNISEDCSPPGEQVTREETTEAPKPVDEPMSKPGMTITESIKAKMPLYAEGNKCISLHHIDGGPQCDDDAIEIRNNCGKLMTVQLALKQKTGRYASEITTTLQNGEKKRIQTGCNKSTDGAKFVAINRRERTNLLCRPEWYLVSMMDLTGKPYVDVPYEAPKKKPTSTVIPGSNPKITFNQKRTAPNTIQEKKNSSSTGFEVTNRFFAASYQSNGKTIYSIYRFGNQSGYQGKKWFRRWEKGSQEFWNAGWWERQGNFIIVTIYEEGNKREWAPLKFKIEGESIRLVEEGRNYNPTPFKRDRFYKKYTLNGTPSWAQPAMDRMLNRFPPN